MRIESSMSSKRELSTKSMALHGYIELLKTSPSESDTVLPGTMEGVASSSSTSQSVAVVVGYDDGLRAEILCKNL